MNGIIDYILHELFPTTNHSISHSQMRNLPASHVHLIEIECEENEAAFILLHGLIHQETELFMSNAQYQ